MPGKVSVHRVHREEVPYRVSANPAPPIVVRKSVFPLDLPHPLHPCNAAPCRKRRGNDPLRIRAIRLFLGAIFDDCSHVLFDLLVRPAETIFSFPFGCPHSLCRVSVAGMRGPRRWSSLSRGRRMLARALDGGAPVRGRAGIPAPARRRLPTVPETQSSTSRPCAQSESSRSCWR